MEDVFIREDSLHIPIRWTARRRRMIGDISDPRVADAVVSHLANYNRRWTFELLIRCL